MFLVGIDSKITWFFSLLKKAVEAISRDKLKRFLWETAKLIAALLYLYVCSDPKVGGYFIVFGIGFVLGAAWESKRVTSSSP